jgi:hypothetical protein
MKNPCTVEMGAAPGKPPAAVEDIREALYNDQATGPAYKIQMPRERITVLHGILFDLDPRVLIPGNPIFPPAEEPKAFYAGIQPVLERHPLVRSSEVRSSGTGLHLILWLRPALELRSAAEQEYWDHVVRAIQRTLPVDPDMPGITALTRPPGAVNSKNGARVEVLKAGEPVEPKAVEEYMARLVLAPFKEVAMVLFGEERIEPCPVCLKEGTRLDVLDRIGKCYGGCGKVSGAHLYNRILRP